jgi:hypothetical protein
MYFITFLHSIQLITATLYIRTAIQLSISLISQQLLTQLFFSKRNVLPFGQEILCFTETQGRLPCSEEPYDKQSYQHQIRNSCRSFLILVFISSSNPCETAQSAQLLGSGLEDLQDMYLFSKTSTQTASPTHSPIQFTPQALFLKEGTQ